MPAEEEKPPKSDPTAREESWSHEAEVERWKAEYQSVKKELENLTPEKDAIGELENLNPTGLPASVLEKRAEPRYTFKAEKRVEIFAHMGPKAFQILNISVGGVAFYSDVQFEPETNLLLSALGMVALDVEVVDCVLEETDSDLMEYQYLVRTKFAPRVNGYLVYVLSREVYLKQLASLVEITQS